MEEEEEEEEEEEIVRAVMRGDEEAVMQILDADVGLLQARNAIGDGLLAVAAADGRLGVATRYLL
jgi:hypothetical protein